MTTVPPSGAVPTAAARPASPRTRQTSEFMALSRAVQESGLLRRRHAYYWTRFLVLTALLGGTVYAFVVVGPSWWQLAVAALLALLLGQVMFLGHDAAHRQIFASGRWNDWASLVIANLYAGMSYGWWQHKHSRHHAKPNQVGADPDIETDVIVFHTQDLTRPRTGLTGWLTQRQGWLFFPLLLLEGVNLHVSGVKTIFGRGEVKRRPWEIAFVTLRIGGYLALVFWLLPFGMAVAFLGVQLGLFGLYMGAVFAPNHKGMPLVPPDARIDFLRRQVAASRNVRGGRLTDLAMGGLNYQIEHHLFPSMPSPNLVRLQPIVRDYCAAHGIPYTETTLGRSWGIVVRYLNGVGLAARDPFQCPLVAQYR
ncbi:fatty acid desaturase family protein [Cellulomonas fimi]|uniref:Fatty acid desaturase n=1 Tax=Cellulomonas fimi (strain ATCC 484 / DSM 20113 / JCM 1341 / CCUG 24087 / LMG 16345 / NBRC 15513 / NCIMB 8980 / NCTC 7547 / NRS-133) TaxID=590998 RepID=F4H1P9_CELFA|nr:acyl-CoA desaturase [Cellulomonas fimi]AEE47469.1 fatty acid desaturase [Cellulomonas fimi ATCC 484]NNH05554.1 acyl-CoA desaturase [Cellulomonas fimi]VEH36303.1 Stearoyl-CoA 9-desaturase [Cellulomonas fimi]